jgi:uncharacterized membrane protein
MKHNELVYEVVTSTGTRWISADISQMLLDLNDLFKPDVQAEITVWRSGVPVAHMDWRKTQTKG